MMADRDDVPARRSRRNSGSDGNGPKKQQRKLQAAEASLHQFVLLRVYILMAITRLGYLALTWSTVVLLGGFVTSLGKKDFWCLMPALDIFYCLVICQGTLFIIWCMNAFAAISFIDSLHQPCKFPEMWGGLSSWRYFSDTRAKCWQDLASIKSRSLITYAVGLLDSESQEDFLSEARMLNVFIKQGVDIRSLILPSRIKIQKLIDTLGWRSSDREIRELAAHIFAYLSSDIHLAEFPGGNMVHILPARYHPAILCELLVSCTCVLHVILSSPR